MQDTKDSDWEWECIGNFDSKVGNRQGAWTKIANLNLESYASPRPPEKYLVKTESQTAKGRMRVAYAKKEGSSVSRASEEFEGEIEVSHWSAEGPLRLLFFLEEDVPAGVWVEIEGKIFRLKKRKKVRKKERTVKDPI